MSLNSDGSRFQIKPFADGSHEKENLNDNKAQWSFRGDRKKVFSTRGFLEN